MTSTPSVRFAIERLVCAAPNLVPRALSLLPAMPPRALAWFRCLGEQGTRLGYMHVNVYECVEYYACLSIV